MVTDVCDENVNENLVTLVLRINRLNEQQDAQAFSLQGGTGLQAENPQGLRKFGDNYGDT